MLRPQRDVQKPLDHAVDLVGNEEVVGSQLVSAIAEWPTIVPIEAILLAVVFSGAVGIFFGFYPARKAAHLDPIQALRYE